eukprot:INCI2457.1.p1 GENE.INCI2457.1~~INCI2457.1.p1  ORF type:complete len:647 (-),score=94.74 INCI2457.1:47-1987(-)
MPNGHLASNSEIQHWLDSKLLVLQDEQLRVPKRVLALRDILQVLAQSCSNAKVSETGIGTNNALDRDLPLDGVDGLVPLRSYAPGPQPAVPHTDDNGTSVANALPVSMEIALQWIRWCALAESLFAPIRLNLAIFRAGLAMLDFLVASDGLELKHLHLLHTAATKSSMRSSVRTKIERCIANAMECSKLQERSDGLIADALGVDERSSSGLKRPGGTVLHAPLSLLPRCGLSNPSNSCHVNCLLQLLYSDATIRQAFTAMVQPLPASGTNFCHAVGGVFLQMLHGPSVSDTNSRSDAVESNVADSMAVLKLLEAEMKSNHPCFDVSKPSGLGLGPRSMRQVLSLFDKCLGLQPHVLMAVPACPSALEGCQVTERIDGKQQSPSGQVMQAVNKTLRKSLLGFLVQTTCSGAKGGIAEVSSSTARAFALSGGLTLVFPFREFSSLSQALAFETRLQRIVPVQKHQELTVTLPEETPAGAGKRDVRIALDGARLPENLFMHVLRSGAPRIQDGKQEVTHQFQLPEFLDVAPFCHDSARLHGSNGVRETEAKWFQLRGVVVHCNVLSSAESGRSSHEQELEGHFVAYTQDCTHLCQATGEGYWIRCDDEHTTPVQPVCHDGTYVFDTGSEEVVLVLYHRLEASANVAQMQ